MPVASRPPRHALAWLMVSVIGAAFLWNALPILRAASVDMVSVDLVCHITKVTASATDGALTVEIDRGGRDGVLLGSQGDVTAAYESPSPQRDEKRQGVTLGRGTVTALAEETATLHIVPDQDAGAYVARAGDWVELKVRVARRGPAGLLLQVAQQGIVMTDNEDTPFFEYRSLLADDSQAVTDRILEAMVPAVREDSVFCTDRGKFPDVTRGRHAGQTFEQAMAATDAEDVREFLEFVATYPGKYTGQTWKVSETYATWMLNDSPPGALHLRALALAAASAAARCAVFKENRSHVSGAISYWNDRAVDAGDAGRFDEAHGWNDLAIEAARCVNDEEVLGDSYFTRGVLFSMADDNEHSLESYRSAVPCWQHAKRFRSAAIVLANIGNRLIALSRYQEALAAFDQSLAIWNTLPEDALAGKTYIGIGLAKWHMGDYKASLEAYRQAGDMYQRLGDPEGAADALSSAGGDYDKMGEYGQALASYESALSIRRQIVDREGEAKELANLGETCWSQSDYPKVREHFQDALAIHRELGDRRNEAYDLSWLAAVEWYLGDQDTSLKTYQEALAIYDELKDVSGEAFLWGRLGIRYKETATYPKAVECTQRARALYRQTGDRKAEADMLSQLGDIEAKASRFDEAIAAETQSLNIRNEIGDKDGAAENHGDLANIYVEQGEVAKAIAATEAALKVRVEIGDKPGQASSYTSLGNLYFDNKDYLSAKDAFARALALRKAMNDPKAVASSLIDAAACMFNLHDVDGAFANTSQALELYRSVRDQWDLEDALERIASLQQMNGDYQGAQRNLEEALAIAKTLDSKAVLASVDRELGRLTIAQGNPVQALAFYQQALALHRELDQEEEQSDDLQRIAYVSYHEGKLDQAKAYFQQALELAVKAGSKRDQADALSSLGDLDADLGDYPAATEALNQSLAVYQAGGNDYGVASVYESLASIQSRQGNFQEAYDLYQKALTFYESVKFKSAMAGVYNEIGNVFIEEGDYDSAVGQLTKALEIERAIQLPGGLAAVLSSLGEAQGLLGRYDESLHNLDEALILARGAGYASLVQDILRAKGRILLAQHQLQPAIATLTEALQAARTVNTPRLIADILTNVGTAYHEAGKEDQAMAALDEAIAISLKTGAVNLQWQAFAGKARVLRAQGKTDDAIAAYQKAVELVEGLRARVAGGESSGQKFLVNKMDVYSELAELLFKADRSEEAFAMFERGKSKQLVDALRLRAVQTGDPQMQALLAQIDDLEGKLRGLESQKAQELAKPAPDTTKVAQTTQLIAQTWAKVRSAFERVKTLDPRWEHLVKARPTSFKEIMPSIPEDSAVVQFCPFEHDLVIYVITRTTAKEFQVSGLGRDQIYAQVRAFRREITIIETNFRKRKPKPITSWKDDGSQEYKRSIAPVKAPLTALYAMLIDPIKDEIKDKKTIAVIPNGLLYYMPIEALAHERPDGELEFLCQEKDIAYLGSADQFTIQFGNRAKIRTTGSFVALGDPSGANLENAVSEVTAIVSLFKRAMMYTDQRATKALIVDRLPKDILILHFATHGILNSEDINDSYLQMADGGAPGTEKLTVPEIYGLQLEGSSLVTLSACETAIGEEDPGLDITGLAGAFSEAGAPTVVGTLWSVYDKSTSYLMVDFYKNLKAAPAQKAGALCSAQRALIKGGTYAHPFYWAPYIMIGVWW